MYKIILIGIGAGLAAALLFGSLISGTVLALPLFIMTGLPIAVAGLGWTPIAGGVAAIVGAAAISILLTPLSATEFLLLIAFPMIWLSRLAGLSRNDGEKLEWFPLGRILVHAAAAVAIGLTAIGFLVGFNPDTMASGLVEPLSEWFASNPNLENQPSREEIEFLVDVNLALMPYLLAALALIIAVLNLWLAGIITHASGHLARPRERLWTTSLPVGAAATFVIALVASFLPFPVGGIAALIVGAFGCMMALIGLAVLHALTIGNSARTALLTLTYLLSFVLGVPILVLILLGLGETFLHFRARRFGGAPPST